MRSIKHKEVEQLLSKLYVKTQCDYESVQNLLELGTLVSESDRALARGLVKRAKTILTELESMQDRLNKG